MKKKLSILLLALTTCLGTNAEPLPIVLEPTINPHDNDGDLPRSPILLPVLYIDGYTLTAGTGTLGSTIQLLDEDDNVVFSTFVFVEGDIQLPTTLSGTYTIQVVFDNITFEGEIEL